MVAKRICLLVDASELSENSLDAVPHCFGELYDLTVQAGDQVSVAYVNAAGIGEVRPGTQSHDISASFEPVPGCPQRLVGPEHTQAAYQAYLWLKAQAFDCVYATGYQGLLFYALMARDQGLAFENTVFCVYLSKPSLLRRYEAQTPVGELGDLIADHLERTVSRLADFTVTSCEQTLDWVSRNEWVLPTGINSLVTAEVGSDTESAGAVRRIDWPELHGGVVRLLDGMPVARGEWPGEARASERPLVTVGIPHHNRPDLLLQAIASIEAQTYPAIELVVVDDASDSPEARAALESIEQKLLSIGGRLIRHASNRYTGAARNTVAAHARGEYLMFLDDDDYAKPHQVETLVAAAERTGADIVNSFCDRFAGGVPPTGDQVSDERWMMLGNALTVGVFRNYFGPASALIRRKSFEKAGGFTEYHGIGHEDWEFFARASLSGMRLELVPEALFWYRMTPNSMVQSMNAFHAHMRNIEPFVEHAPDFMKPVLFFATGLEQRNIHLKAEVAGLRESLESAQAELRELGSVMSVILPPDVETPEEALEAARSSKSWRITAPLRVFMKEASASHRVSSFAQAAIEIYAMRQSLCWDFAAPVRIVGRLFRRRMS